MMENGSPGMRRRARRLEVLALAPCLNWRDALKAPPCKRRVPGIGDGRKSHGFEVTSERSGLEDMGFTWISYDLPAYHRLSSFY